MDNPHVSRVEHEMNFGWATANPDLFVQRFKTFTDEHPVTHWQHHIDLSAGWKMKLIATRRDQPFDSVTDYVMHPTAYLRESGYEV